MSNLCVVSFHRSCIRAAALVLMIVIVAPGVSYAQHQRAAGVFLGVSHPEKRVIWHGLAEETMRDLGFSIGAIYEIGLSEMFTVVLSPQYSEVSHAWSNQYPRNPEASDVFRELSVPPMYAIELPVSIRGGVSLGALYPYVAIGGFVGYAFPDQAANYREDYGSTPRLLPSVQIQPVSRFIAGVQVGVGISADLARGISIEVDWMLNQHLTDPIDSDMVTWEAPLRAGWRFAVVFPLEGGAR
jgi:hypothetical protein